MRKGLARLFAPAGIPHFPHFSLAASADYRHYIPMRIISIASLFLGAILICGCQNFMDNPYFTVKESALNWVEIRQYTISDRTQRVRVRIDGSGIVTVREGTSPLVGDPFAANVNHERWDDIRESRLTIPREDVQFLFQTMVDKGLFVEQKKPDDEEIKKGAVYVSANIQCKTTSSSDPVTDPDLLDHLKMIVQMYYHPTPLKRR
jgi:hypothetical protein